MFIILGHPAEEYCLLPGITKEQRTFTTNYADKTLIVSIQRLPRTEGMRSIIGTVVEMEQFITK